MKINWKSFGIFLLWDREGRADSLKAVVKEQIFPPLEALIPTQITNWLNCYFHILKYNAGIQNFVAYLYFIYMKIFLMNSVRK